MSKHAAVYKRGTEAQVILGSETVQELTKALTALRDSMQSIVKLADELEREFCVQTNIVTYKSAGVDYGVADVGDVQVLVQHSA